MTKLKLARCPFCGGEAEIIKEHACEWEVKCTNNNGSCCSGCHVSLNKEFLDMEEAIAEWNTRAEGLSREKIERAVCKATGWLKHEMRTEDYEFTDRIVDAIIAATARGEK